MTDGLPWTKTHRQDWWDIENAEGGCVASQGVDATEDDGDRIVISVNSHRALLAACRAARKAMSNLNGKVSREVWSGLYEVNCVLDEAIEAAQIAKEASTPGGVRLGKEEGR